jgi:hypothetical protein
MNQVQSSYHSYLLRLWQVKTNGDHWRATLEDVESGELHGFEDLPALLRYLEGLSFTRQEKDVLAGQRSGEGRGQGAEPRE